MAIYACLLHWSNLEICKEPEKCFEEWKFDGLSYDIRVPNVLIDAYITKGMIEKAESFLEHVLEKGGKPNFKTWEMFVDGYLENNQMNQAIETMKKAISKVKNREWQPTLEKALEYIDTNYIDMGV